MSRELQNVEYRHFTTQELNRYNGINGAPAYIAYKESVFDVTGSFHWQQGTHQVLHQAGMDLTECMAEAPHGEEFLEKFPKVGTYRKKLHKTGVNMPDQGSGTQKEHSLDDRIRGAIWGQFVGDAFCLGSHWIYDLVELNQRFPNGPQGFETPVAGHYHFGKRSGDLSHYGDGALVILQSLAAQGSFDTVDFGLRFMALFDSPGYKGYRDHATKETIANFHTFHDGNPGADYTFQDGADDDQPATVSRLAPLAALYFRSENYLSVVERATRVCQNNQRAVAYALAHALILRELFSGSHLHDAVRASGDIMATRGAAGSEVNEWINAAMAATHLDVWEATHQFGQACPLKASFPSALQCALHHGGNFVDALRANAAAGGDNAGRAAMIGAWLGAGLGVDALPLKWRELLTAREEISAGVERIAAAVQ